MISIYVTLYLLMKKL